MSTYGTQLAHGVEHSEMVVFLLVLFGVRCVGGQQLDWVGCGSCT